MRNMMLATLMLVTGCDWRGAILVPGDTDTQEDTGTPDRPPVTQEDMVTEACWTWVDDQDLSSKVIVDLAVQETAWGWGCLVSIGNSSSVFQTYLLDCSITSCTEMDHW